MGNATSKRFNALMLGVSASRSLIWFKERFVRTCTRGADAMGSVHRLLGTSEGVISFRATLNSTDGSGSLHAQLVSEVRSAHDCTNEDAIVANWVSISSPSRSL